MTIKEHPYSLGVVKGHMAMSQQLVTIISGHSTRIGMVKKAGLPAIPRMTAYFALPTGRPGELLQHVMVLDTTLEAMLRVIPAIESQMDPRLEGLLTYNMTTQKWTNESIEALECATWSGTATCIPSIGWAGLLVFLGGAKGVGSGRSNESDPVSFTVTIYDLESKSWYWQLTTGGPPDPRVEFCSVGMPRKNGTFTVCEVW